MTKATLLYSNFQIDAEVTHNGEQWFATWGELTASGPSARDACQSLLADICAKPASKVKPVNSTVVTQAMLQDAQRNGVHSVLAHVQETVIKAALVEQHGNISAVAKELGIARKTVEDVAKGRKKRLVRVRKDG